ncbi:hypothetical protein [Paenibacillus qinlingensis]|uniref:hypothetical protein n=1 Tax=Paenibacillus qinlingensis TaxID=1837343 RepID=UPI0015648707|nr:hypothetical protein [Paenibacillus qinlingensis]NQX59979.1 hypothetical protein [Paenibacillus qinlingensis]
MVQIRGEGIADLLRKVTGNISSIKFNGLELSPNLRIINMVVFDIIHLALLSAYRVDTFVTNYDDSAIYSASLEAEANET